MKEIKFLIAVIAIGIAVAFASTQYITTTASGTPMHDTLDCPYCGGSAEAQNPTGKFLGDWKCMRCLKSFKQ